jgi:hypothetical protein
MVDTLKRMNVVLSHVGDWCAVTEHPSDVVEPSVQGKAVFEDFCSNSAKTASQMSTVQ